MNPLRRCFLVALGLTLACKEPQKETYVDPVPPAEEDMTRLADELVSGEGFAFGAPDQWGVAIGIALDNTELRVGERLRYRVAARNTGPEAVNRVLWSNFEDNTLTPTKNRRTRLGVREPGGAFSSLGTAVGYSMMLGTMPFSISMALEPGQTRSREGNSLAFDREGEFEVAILFGGPEFG